MMKAIQKIFEDKWITSSGRSDLEGFKIALAQDKGRRDNMGE